jgi:hypothetical protein
VNYFWEKSPQNIEKGGWGLYLLPKDFVKIGHMVLSDGVYEGQRILSSEYLKTATSKHVEVVKESQAFDYGYQIWVGKHADTFLFNGMLGQNVLGFRRNGIVISANAGNGEFFQTSNYFKYLMESFDQDFETALPRNLKGEKLLNKTVKSLSLYYPAKKSFNEWFLDFFALNPQKQFDEIAGDYAWLKGDKGAVGVMPLILQGVQNEYAKGFESVSFVRKEGVPHLVYCETNTAYEIPLGFDIPIRKHFTFGKIDFLVAVHAKFRHDEENRLVLIVRLDFLETPCSRVLKFVFGAKDEVIMAHSELPGEEFVAEATSELLKGFADSSLPFVSGVMDRFAEDYVELKLKKAFSPTLKLRKKK